MARRHHRRRHRVNTPRRRHRRRNPTMHHRRRAHRRRNPFMRRHHRRRRRNPGLGSFMRSITTGAKEGLFVMGGRVSSRAIPDLTGIAGLIANSPTITGFPATVFLALAQMAAGVLAGYAVGRTMGASEGALVVAGAFDGIYEDLLSSLSVPVIGSYLGNPGAPLAYNMRRTLAGYSANAAVVSIPGAGGAGVNPATGSRMARVAGYSSGINRRSRLLTGGGLSGGRMF